MIEQMQIRQDELQQMLTHSHLLLEEKSAIIESLPFTMQSKSADVKNLGAMREHGRDETVRKYDKMFADQKKSHEKEAEEVKRSFKYRLNQKNEDIREYNRQWEEFNSKKNSA